MSRSTRHAGYVNRISLDDFSDLLGPKFEDVLRAGLSNVFAEFGLKLAEAIIQGEIEGLCGPKHSRKNRTRRSAGGRRTEQ